MQDVCAAALGVVERCFGQDMLPEQVGTLRRRRAFRRGKALGMSPVLRPHPTARSRWLSATLRRSIPAYYRTAIKTLNPIVPRNFPLRWLHRIGYTEIRRHRRGRW